jgi:crotonobetainyl-CoA:carnitine CoA-transferase CaiB-like acyl-CoA transferase
MSSTPLRGVKVLEFAHAIMGPTAGLLMADMGADVIKVEPAPDGDPTRRLPGFGAGFFPGFNRNKRSIAIDLKRSEGQAAVHRLAAQADVVIENYGPGTMERLGCGYEQLHALNPRLLYLALKGFLAGPYEHRPALDEVVQFLSGLAYMTGPPGQPLRAGASINDILGGVFGVAATLAALRERDITGVGQRISSALFEAAAFLMVTHMAGFIASGQEPRPMPARRHAWAIYDVFATADEQQLFIGVTSDPQWKRFTDVFGLDAMAADARLATNPMRAKERSWMIPALREVIAQHASAEVQKRCEHAAVSWAPVGKPTDLFADPHLSAHDGLLDVQIPTIAGLMQTAGLPNLPIEFGAGRERTKLRRQPPKVGEHSAEVLMEAGFSADEVARLASAQTITAGS